MLYPMKLLPFVAIQQSGAAESESSQILRSVYSYRRQRSGDRRHRADTAHIHAHPRHRQPFRCGSTTRETERRKDLRKEPMSAAARPV